MATDSMAVEQAEPAGMKRNVLLLSGCVALSGTGASIVMVVTALAGKSLADNPLHATLPLALQFTFTAVGAVPAALMMRRIGRRAGFTIGQLVGCGAAAVSAYAILIQSFALFAVGGALLGIHNAFWQQLRFAAGETSSHRFRSRAISYVMAGGVAGALFGPELAEFGFDLFEPVLFAGSYVVIGVLCLLGIVVLQFVDIPRTDADRSGDSGRPLAEILRQPVVVVAIIAGMLGYAVMSLVMTATPLAMEVCGFVISDSARVIQWHAVAMFAPGFFTGHLIKRYGVIQVIFAGVVLNVLCLVMNTTGVAFFNFWFGLVFLGLGWNFMFVGATNLLTEGYRPEERAKVQAANDFLVFSGVAVASFSSGALQEAYGWTAVNLAIALPVTVVFAAVVWYRFLYRPPATA